jgi:hypothetical protein
MSVLCQPPASQPTAAVAFPLAKDGAIGQTTEVRLSVVVPCFNERDAVEQTLQKLEQA